MTTKISKWLRALFLKRGTRAILSIALSLSWTLTGLPQFPFINFPTEVKEAQAVYTGKHLRTIEYVLGGNASATAASDNTTRSSNTLAYAGSSWNTVKATAGTKTVKIAGSGIKVKHAYLEVWWHGITGSDTTDIDVFIDVANGPSPGTDAPVDAASGVIINSNGGLTKTNKTRADVTAFFDRQSDAQFNAGLATVIGVRHTGEIRTLTSAKLIITYEQNYSTTAHTETKTVRFPLNSSVAGDEGSMRAACAASDTTTCNFDYNANIPDAAADADILDVFFEIHAEVISVTASNFTPRVSGGIAGPAYNWADSLTGDTNVNVLWRPTVGGDNFLRSTAQVLDIDNGTVALGILGGELVVTYNFSTGAATQTETVSYFMLQQTAATGVTKTTNAAVATNISNGSFSVKNIWYKVHAAETETNTWTVFGTVGAAAERSQGYTVGDANTVRVGDIATVFFDLTQDIGSYTASPTNLDIETQWSSATGDAPISAEAFITFTWSGSGGGTVTKTVKFGATPAGAETVASEDLNVPIYLSLPETVTKTYRSAYVEANIAHSETLFLGAVDTYTTRVDGSAQVVTGNTEEGTATTNESYLLTHYQNVSSTLFSNGATIAWTQNVFMLSATHNQADEKYATFAFTVTYDAALAAVAATLTQNDFEFWVDNDALTPVAIWGNPDIAENTALNAVPPSNDPIDPADEIRIRMNISVTVATLAASTEDFILQYKEAPDCTDAAAWTDVDATGGAGTWRFAASAVTDNTTLTTLLVSTSNVAGRYNKSDPTTTNPNAVTAGQAFEWDWHVEYNGTAAAKTYCFRMVKSPVAPLDAYNADSYPRVDTRPGTADQMRHGNFFTTGVERGFFWAD